jgi:hypothetical protein
LLETRADRREAGEIGRAGGDEGRLVGIDGLRFFGIMRGEGRGQILLGLVDRIERGGVIGWCGILLAACRQQRETGGGGKEAVFYGDSPIGPR